MYSALFFLGLLAVLALVLIAAISHIRANNAKESSFYSPLDLEYEALQNLSKGK